MPEIGLFDSGGGRRERRPYLIEAIHMIRKESAVSISEFRLKRSSLSQPKVPDLFRWLPAPERVMFTT
jgi:hypothetical protein